MPTVNANTMNVSIGGKVREGVIIHLFSLTTVFNVKRLGIWNIQLWFVYYYGGNAGSFLFIIHFCSKKLHNTLKHCAHSLIWIYLLKQKFSEEPKWHSLMICFHFCIKFPIFRPQLMFSAGPIKEKLSCAFEEALRKCFFPFKD